MNLKCIMLTEDGQIQKATYSIVLFIWYSRNFETTRTENRSVVTWGLGVGEALTTKVTQGNIFWWGEMYLDGDGGSMTVTICQNLLNSTLKKLSLYTFILKIIIQQYLRKRKSTVEGSNAKNFTDFIRTNWKTQLAGFVFLHSNYCPTPHLKKKKVNGKKHWWDQDC